MKTMREEFEDDYWENGVPSNMVGPRSAFFARKLDDSYRLSHVDGAWWGYRTAISKKESTNERRVTREEPKS